MTTPEGKDRAKIEKKNSSLGRIWKQVSEFMDHSSIHGFKYITGSNRTIFEKSLWFLVLSVSVYTCSILIKSTWQKWEENPTFVSFSQTPVRVWEIPFPAVTICFDYAYNKQSNYTFSCTTDGKDWHVGTASEACEAYGHYKFFNEFGLKEFSEGPKWEEFTMRTAILPQQFLHFVSFQLKSVLFSPIRTRLGVCYSFNTLDKTNLLSSASYVPSFFGNQDNVSCWSYDKNYCKTNKSVYPHRARTMDDVLTIGLNSRLEELGCYGENYYYIQLHHPGEIPNPQDIIPIEIQRDYLIFIKPEIIIASEHLKTYSPYRKKCFFSDERYLKFYKFYTQTNCKLECRANYTLRNCGCVPQELPHNKMTKLCARSNLTTYYCLTKSDGIMDETESGLRENDLNLPLCNCLPSCNSIRYNARINWVNSAITGVGIKFDDTSFNVLERQELFGDVDFWASCGGILGLFLGFSIISLAEIGYFLLVRWLCAWVKRLWK
ncbi:hypothetical protein Zmor_000244 [Zophobas morio]|uniref:Sodium channel protein Nach n=1 Tax=Zophobas morio TaxID=2755281 RepID=A0AA38J5P1_9CUCU|nr:hypothetical protein Zmor_000244 [Zophobas morio]